MVCFRYIIVNTLHKGDNEDDNNDSVKNNRDLCIKHIVVPSVPPYSSKPASRIEIVNLKKYLSWRDNAEKILLFSYVQNYGRH